MTAKLEVVDSIRQRVDVEAPAEKVKEAYAQAMDAVRKDKVLPGFRKGKAPDNILLSKFADEIRHEAIKKVVAMTYPDAIAEVQANPISNPEIVPLSDIDPKKPFSYQAIFEIYPDVNLKGYEGLELEREKAGATDEEVDLELKRLQMQMTTLEPAPDAALEHGMVAMIDFKGTAGGEVFPGSEAENYVVDFGSGNLLKEFEIQIKGMKAGEDRKIEFDYPGDYFRKEIAGKRGVFTVKTKEVRKKNAPELNDDFAKSLGNFQTLNEVKVELKKRILQFKEQMWKNKMIEQAIRKLIEKHSDLEVPTTLIDAELGNMLDQMKRQMESQGKDIKDLKIEPREFVKANLSEATDRARGYMLISAIAKAENIAVTDEEVDQRINLFAEQTKQPAAKIRQQMEANKQMGNLRSQMIFEKTLDVVIGKAKVKEVKPKKKKEGI